MGKFWCHKGRLRVAQSFRPINPFREKRNTHTQATPVFLYEEIQSGHMVRKKSAKTCFYIFFTYKSLDYSGLEWSTTALHTPLNIYRLET